MKLGFADESFIGVSFGTFLTGIPIAGSKYVVSRSNFRLQPSAIAPFFVCEITFCSPSGLSKWWGAAKKKTHSYWFIVTLPSYVRAL